MRSIDADKVRTAGQLAKNAVGGQGFLLSLEGKSHDAVLGLLCYAVGQRHFVKAVQLHGVYAADDP